MVKSTTERGFDMITFTDLYDKECTIQKSSLATADTIWLGITSPEPIVMAQDAKKVGIKTKETVGWIEYPVPEEVLITTRMHLNQEQAAELIEILENFVETGEI